MLLHPNNRYIKVDRKMKSIQVNIPIKPVHPKIEEISEYKNNKSNTRIPLLPYPQIYHFTNAFSQMSYNFTIYVQNINPDHSVFELIKQDFDVENEEELHCAIKLEESPKEITLNDDFHRFKVDFSKKGPEAYYLAIKSNEIQIITFSAHGLFNAFQTLRQLLLWTKNHSLISSEFPSSFILPHGEILDWPDFSMRGISDDISRGQIPTVEELMRELRIMSHFKINTYAMYIEDVVQIPSHPDIGANRGAYTSEEIQQIVTYARSRFITVFPIIETLGHMDNILTLPAYANLGEFPGAHCLSIANGNIYPFLKEFITEIASYFPKLYIHIGCDEVYDLGHGNSKELINAVGMEQAVFDHILKVYRIAKDNDIENVIIYHDLIEKYPSILEHLPSDIIVMYWNYSPKKKYSKIINKLTASDHPIVLSPSILNWYRPFPHYEDAFQNMLHFSDALVTIKKPILGQLVSNWGDFGHHSLRPNQIYGSILGNLLSWNSKSRNFALIMADLLNCIFQPSKGINPSELADLFINTVDLSKICTAKTYFLQSHFFDDFYSPLTVPFSRHLKLKRLEQIFHTINKILTRFEEIIPHIRSNSFFLEYWLHSLQTMYIFLLHLQLKNKLLKKPQNSSEDNLYYTQIRILQEFISQLSVYFQKYEKLWLKCAKFPNFERHRERFNLLMWFYERLIQHLQKFPTLPSPNRFLQSKFIWSHHFASDSRPRLFRKAFSIDEENSMAFLQVIAGNYCEIYCNDIYVGSTNSRFSLSILPIKNAVQVFNISEFLHRGENTLVIECWHFLRFRGFVNILLQIQNSRGEITEITSDKSWSVAMSNYETLVKARVHGNLHSFQWKRAKIVGDSVRFGGGLFHPQLWKGERSIQKDYFRFQDNSYYFSLMYFRPFLAKIIRFFTILKS